MIRGLRPLRLVDAGLVHCARTPGRKHVSRAGNIRQCRQCPPVREVRRVSHLLRNLGQRLHIRRRRHILERRVLTQLQRADVGRNRPAILDRDLRRIIRHGAIPVADDVKIMAQRLLQDARLQQISRRLVAALDDHAAPVSNPGMARRAVDIEPLLAAQQHGHRNRETASCPAQRCRSRRYGNSRRHPARRELQCQQPADAPSVHWQRMRVPR